MDGFQDSPTYMYIFFSLTTQSVYYAVQNLMWTDVHKRFANRHLSALRRMIPVKQEKLSDGQSVEVPDGSFWFGVKRPIVPVHYDYSSVFHVQVNDKVGLLLVRCRISSIPR